MGHRLYVIVYPTRKRGGRVGCAQTCLSVCFLFLKLMTLLHCWQNKIVALDPFSPKEVTVQDREAGLCNMSQFPTQAGWMISGDGSSQFPSQSQHQGNTPIQSTVSRDDSFKEEPKQSSVCNKRARLLENDNQKSLPSSGVYLIDPICNIDSIGDNISKDKGEVSHAVPDVAAAIEDLLEQTSKVEYRYNSFASLLIIKFISLLILLNLLLYKIHEQESPGRTACDKSVSIYFDSFLCIF